jgi:hypothetical protein
MFITFAFVHRCARKVSRGKISIATAGQDAIWEAWPSTADRKYILAQLTIYASRLLPQVSARTNQKSHRKPVAQWLKIAQIVPLNADKVS